MFSLSPFQPEKLASRDGFSTLRLNLVLTHGISTVFHEGFHIYIINRYRVSPKFIGSLHADGV